jgi:hypothetical protein
MSAPIPTSTAQAGTKNERKASDSAKARAKTTGAAHTSCSLTNSITCRVSSSKDMSPPIRIPLKALWESLQ